MRPLVSTRVGAACMALSLAFVLSASAGTILVRPDGTGDHATLQLAVDAATPGDVIELADGVYRGLGNAGLVLRGADVVIRSQSGDPSACVIDADGMGRAMIVPADAGSGLRVVGIRFTGGAIPPSLAGGNVHCAAPASFENCWFENGSAGTGGAVAVTADARFIACAFVGNLAGQGTAVHASGSPLFEDCHFVGNTAGTPDDRVPSSGGAILASGAAGRVRIDRCTFTDNPVNGEGAAATFRAIEGATVIVRASVVERGEGSPLGIDDGGSGTLDVSCSRVDGVLIVPDGRETRCTTPGATDRDDLGDLAHESTIPGHDLDAAPGSAHAVAATAPSRFRAHPNPSRTGIAIRSASEDGFTVEVFDVGGRAIWRGRSDGPELRWEGRSFAGQAVVPGTYFARVTAGRITETLRLVVRP